MHFSSAEGCGYWLWVDPTRQRLQIMDMDGAMLAAFPVSTAAAGLGEEAGSLRTPRGWHYVRARIGEGLPENAVLVGRRWTGEIYDAEIARCWPERDWILTRILWLCGLEPGRNRGGRVDSFRRYIYIHGTPDLERLGSPASHGCVRMASTDLLTLWPAAVAGLRVYIGADRPQPPIS